MSDSKRTDNDGVAVKTKDRPPKITSSKSTGEITIKHRKIEKKDKSGDNIAKDGSVTDRAEKDKDKKEKKKKSSDPSKKDKKKRDSFRLSKSLVDPNAESKTATSDEHKASPHTIGSPHPLQSSLSTPNIKGIESSSGSRSGNHSRHSSKDDSSNTNSTPRKSSKTPRSPRIDALKESDTDADEHTDEDKQTIATLKFKRDQFIRTISSRHVQLPMHVRSVFSETVEESDDESSSSGMDWEDPNFELQIDQQIKELGEPLPEETALLSNLQSMLKIPTWKNDNWIQTLQEEKDRVEKDKRKSLNADQIETGGRRSSLGPLSSPSTSRSTLDSARGNRASSGSKPVMKAKVGYVLLKSKLGPWKRRYLILDDTRLLAKKSPMEAKAKLAIPMLFSQCKSIDKPLSGKRKLYMFEIFTPDTKFLMATDSLQSTQDWVTSIQKACDNQMLQSLDLQENASGNHRDREDLKPEVKELLEIMEVPGNNICTDCDAADPEWAVINIGNFVCIDCSGVHRALGVQVSKVRSIYLDNWEPDAVAYMRTMGNKKVNEIWESKVPSYREKPKQNSTREKRMFWIVSKYVKKEFFDWNRAGEAKIDPENQQSISNTVLAAKMIPNDMAELKKAILNLVKEDDSFRKQMKDLIFGDNEMRQALDSETNLSKDKGRNRATTTTGL
eukprot:TRINITY_DN2939_c0_g1_i1.p1 TRINITY_DN2939_c0_g1~~TRINITY_DN2939_c0_g1_i1.p1  ORF type:complete len:672 (-),score=156.69 TRINITY_DN2939_c0_g1_i1:32-2047(-)